MLYTDSIYIPYIINIPEDRIIGLYVVKSITDNKSIVVILSYADEDMLNQAMLSFRLDDEKYDPDSHAIEFREHFFEDDYEFVKFLRLLAEMKNLDILIVNSSLCTLHYPISRDIFDKTDEAYNPRLFSEFLDIIAGIPGEGYWFSSKDLFAMQGRKGERFPLYLFSTEEKFQDFFGEDEEMYKINISPELIDIIHKAGVLNIIIDSNGGFLEAGYLVRDLVRQSENLKRLLGDPTIQKYGGNIGWV